MHTRAGDVFNDLFPVNSSSDFFFQSLVSALVCLFSIWHLAVHMCESFPCITIDPLACDLTINQVLCSSKETIQALPFRAHWMRTFFTTHALIDLQDNKLGLQVGPRSPLLLLFRVKPLWSHVYCTPWVSCRRARTSRRSTRAASTSTRCWPWWAAGTEK